MNAVPETTSALVQAVYIYIYIYIYLYVSAFSLEPKVSPVHSSALDSVVGVYAEDSVMHVGDAEGKDAMVDTDDRAADDDGGFGRS